MHNSVKLEFPAILLVINDSLLRTLRDFHRHRLPTVILSYPIYT